MTANATPIYENNTFYVPRFEIELQGQNLSRSVIRDVTDVSYKDSLTELDSFEFTLHDWDPALNDTKYSSPYDESGNLKRLPDGSPVPLFDPGADVSLRLGYYGPEEPELMLTGKIVAITPKFPSSGAPTLQVRALNPLYALQKGPKTIVFDAGRTDSEIAQSIGQEVDIQVEIPPGQIDNETPYDDQITLVNEDPITFLMDRARRLGYDMRIQYPEDGGDPVLFFGRIENNESAYELHWGRTLVEFAPTVRTKGQVTKVVVRGWLPGQSGGDRAALATALLRDVSLDLPDPKLAEAIDNALDEFHEEKVEEPVESLAEAERTARRVLIEKLQEMITGRGTTVGLPKLRAGQSLFIRGIGFRYSGRYLVTESTHTVGGSGYTTQFTARMEAGL